MIHLFLADVDLKRGIIITPQHMPVGTVIEALLLVVHAGNAADLRNRVLLLPGFSIYGF